MTTSKIIYFKTYPINGVFWEKIGIEVDLQPGDDARNALYEAKRTVESFHYESNKAAEKQADLPGTFEGTIELINKCTTIPKPHGLMAYEIIAKTNKSIQDAWDAKFIELSQQ